MKDRFNRRKFIEKSSLITAAVALAACTPAAKETPTVDKVPEISPLPMRMETLQQYKGLSPKTIYVEPGPDPSKVQVLFNRIDPHESSDWTGWTMKLEIASDPNANSLDKSAAQNLPDSSFKVVKELGVPQYTSENGPEILKSDLAPGKYLLRMSVRPPGDTSWDPKTNPKVEHYYAILDTAKIP